MQHSNSIMSMLDLEDSFPFDPHELFEYVPAFPLFFGEQVLRLPDACFNITEDLNQPLVEVLEESGARTEGWVIDWSSDSLTARILYRDCNRRDRLYEVGKQCICAVRKKTEGQVFLVGNLVEVYSPSRCSWLLGTVTHFDNSNDSYMVQLACDATAIATSSERMRLAPSIRRGSLVEVAGGDGSPQALGSFYEGVVVEQNASTGRVRVKWSCLDSIAKDDDKSTGRSKCRGGTLLSLQWTNKVIGSGTSTPMTVPPQKRCM
jgi:hypothetical protein